MSESVSEESVNNSVNRLKEGKCISFCSKLTNMFFSTHEKTYFLCVFSIFRHLRHKLTAQSQTTLASYKSRPEIQEVQNCTIQLQSVSKLITGAKVKYTLYPSSPLKSLVFFTPTMYNYVHCTTMYILYFYSIFSIYLFVITNVRLAKLFMFYRPKNLPDVYCLS